MEMAKHTDKKKVNLNNLVNRLYEEPVKKLKENLTSNNVSAV